jgi:hypothetical protein
MTIEQVTTEALKLEPGAVYAIECDSYLSTDQFVEVTNALRKQSESIGCKFLLLDKGMKIARAAANQIESQG